MMTAWVGGLGWTPLEIVVVWWRHVRMGWGDEIDESDEVDEMSVCFFAFLFVCLLSCII